LFDIIINFFLFWFFISFWFLVFLNKFPDKTPFFFDLINFLSFFVVPTFLNRFIKHQTGVHFSFFLHILNHFQGFGLRFSLVFIMILLSLNGIPFVSIIEDYQSSGDLFFCLFSIYFVYHFIENSLLLNLILQHKPNPKLIPISQFVCTRRWYTHQKSYD